MSQFLLIAVKHKGKLQILKTDFTNCS